MKKAFTKVVIFLVSFALLWGTLFPAQRTHAQTAALGQVATGFVECILDTALEDRFDDLLAAGAASLKGFLERHNPFGDFLDKLGEKLETILGADNVPIAVEEDRPAAARDYKACLSKEFKRRLVAAAVTDILEYIRSDDKKRFISNYGDELKYIADGAAANLVRDVSGVNICQPFRAHFEVILSRAAFPDRFNQPAQFECTLSQAIDRQEIAFERFKDDFRHGGWDTWIRMYDNANNELGFWLAVNDQQIIEVARAQEAAKTEAVAGQGFRSEKACRVASIYDVVNDRFIRHKLPRDLVVDSAQWNQEIQRVIAREGVGAGPVISCDEFGDIITPGNLIASQAQQAVNAEFEELINSEPTPYSIIKDVVVQAIGEMIGRLEGGI